MIQAINNTVAAQPGEAVRKDKTLEAAKQFESLLIAQMLKNMREESDADSVMQMAEEHLASALSAQGGLGLANMVAAGLAAEGQSRD